MATIESITFTEKFERDVKSVRDGATKEKVQKQIQKILANPEAGKPLRYDLKGERSLRINSYRLIYALDGKRLILLRFMHRDEVYG